jgi:hypothetical protein
MKSQTYKNIITGQIVICENSREIKTIDGVEYLTVTRPGDYQNRSFMIRRDSLKKIEKEKSN